MIVAENDGCDSPVRQHCGKLVMAGLVPAIHVLVGEKREDVDARHKAGHDE